MDFGPGIYRVETFAGPPGGDDGSDGSNDGQKKKKKLDELLDELLVEAGLAEETENEEAEDDKSDDDFESKLYWAPRMQFKMTPQQKYKHFKGVYEDAYADMRRVQRKAWAKKSTTELRELRREYRARLTPRLEQLRRHLAALRRAAAAEKKQQQRERERDNQ